jgi:hypothetical protein
MEKMEGREKVVEGKRGGQVGVGVWGVVLILTLLYHISLFSAGSWVLFNDAIISAVTAQEVKASQAYLLFYERRHVSLML